MHVLAQSEAILDTSPPEPCTRHRSLIPVGAALIYVASLSVILVQEWNEPKLLVVACFAPSVLVGLVVKRFSALLLPLGRDRDLAALGPTRRRGPDRGDARGPTRRRRARSRPRADAAARAGRAGADRRAGASLAGPQARGEAARDAGGHRLGARPHPIPHRHVPARRLPARRVASPGPRAPAAAAPSRAGRRSSRSSASRPSRPRSTSAPARATSRSCSARPESRRSRSRALPAAARTAMFAVRRSGLEDVGVLALTLTPGNVVAVPASDCTICLSIWHHFVRYYGVDGGDRDDGDDLEPDRQGALLRHRRERDDARLRAARR